ncbi:MAG: prephenate dehydratase [Chloroflexi bacterium]|nr:prephenate dehydratase [Chloroflexota bacterium]
MGKRVAYLGPAGTFTEEAVLQYDASAVRLPFLSIFAAAEAVHAGMAEEGVVPIENSLEGSVTDTLDLLIHESDLRICRELVLPIEHCLMVKPGTDPELVQTIYSHPQALAQCRRFIERCFPRAQVVAALSTAAAVEEMKKSSGIDAAIAPQRAAQVYGVDILAKGIQDSPLNVTRFVVLAHADSPPTGADKTSLCFSFNQDGPGLLHKAIGEFALRGINLVKIESRPAKQTLGRYIFLVDLEGHQEDAVVRQALEALRRQADMVKIFGSYPRYLK